MFRTYGYGSPQSKEIASKKGIEEMPGYDEISEELLHSATAASSTTATESVASALLLAALFPQDAKETAAKATNKNRLYNIKN